MHALQHCISNMDVQFAPKRLYPWVCQALLRFLGPARFVILQGFLLGVAHVAVGSFILIPLLCKGCTEPQGIPRFLKRFPARLLPLPLLFVQGARRQLGVETFLAPVDHDVICKTSIPLEALVQVAL